MTPALLLLLCYLLGTFPTGLLIARFKGRRIEEEGSKSVGATNVARILGKKWGVLTLVVDVLKGMLAVELTREFSGNDDLAALGGVSAVLGHCFSIPGVLRGGKGVATSLGAIGAINGIALILVMAVFVLVFSVKRIVSLGSLLAAAALFVFSLLGTEGLYERAALMLMSVIVALRHRENIERLLSGAEKPFEAGRSG